MCANPYGFTWGIYLTNKEALTVLCSVVKPAGSGRARKKCRGKHETQSSVFPHFYLFYDKEFNNFPMHSLNFQTKFYFPKE